MIYWCNKCLIPIIDKNKCPNCKGKINEISRDIRPVFLEEKLLVSLLFENNILNNSVWATKSARYIIDGEKIRVDYSKIKDKELDLSQIRKKLENKVYQKKHREISKRYIDMFIENNLGRLDYIRTEAEMYVKKVVKKYSSKNYIPVVSFSGGKDSIVISYLVREALCDPKIIHVFGDTTIEFPYTYNYIEKFKNQNKLTPFFVESQSPFSNNDQGFMDLCRIFGPPSRLQRWCCNIFKTNPIGRVIGSFPNNKKALTFMGIRKSESRNRSDYDRTQKKSKISRQISSFPILNWKDSDVWLYILANSIPFNKAYKLGYRRVGCWLCPNNSSWSEFLTRLYMPDKYNKWRNLLFGFAKKAGKKDYKIYVDQGYWKARRGNRGVDTNLKDVRASDCNISEDAKSYILKRKVEEDFKELMKPFGNINSKINDREFKWNIKWKINNSANKEKAEIVVEGIFGSKVLKVIPKNVKNIITFFRRFECQIRKYENCIYCSACDNTCPQFAIQTTNNKYEIDESKCSNCKKCIANFYNGCLKFDVLK